MRGLVIDSAVVGVIEHDSTFGFVNSGFRFSSLWKRQIEIDDFRFIVFGDVDHGCTRCFVSFSTEYASLKLLMSGNMHSS